MANAYRDENSVPTLIASSLTDGKTPVRLYADPITHRLLVDLAGGSGTVTEIDTGTGLTGGPITSTGTISLDSKLAPLDTLGSPLQSVRVNAAGTALEYYTPGSGGTPGGSNLQIQYNNAGAFGGVSGVTSNGTSMQFASSDLLLAGSSSGGVTLNAPATGGGVLTLPPGTDTVAGLAATQALTNKTYNGNTWTAGTGVLTIAAAKTLTMSNTLTFTGTDGSSVNFGTGGTVLYGNQTITLSGDITGSGTTAITTTLATVNTNVGSFGSATQVAAFTVNGKGLTTAASNITITPAVGSITGLGTGVATALAIAVGSAGAFVTFNGAGGTPSSITLTNGTGLPIAGITGLGTGVGTWLATPSSANLAAAITDETGTGKLVFASKPTFIGTVQTIAALGALAIDGSTGSYFTKTIATGSTFTQSNFSTGQMFVVKVSGAFTITWFSGITWLTSGATAPAQTALTSYGFVCTGSNTFDGYLVGTQ